MKIELAKLQKDYDENTWNPFLDYELHWSEELIETYLWIAQTSAEGIIFQDTPDIICWNFTY